MNGLETQCLAEGSDGTLWFGTADGMSSYDGFEWKRYVFQEGGVLAGWVSGICVEPDGAVDACGWWGISQFRDGRWLRLVPAVGGRFADVRRLACAPDGTVWAATSWGALRRGEGGWTLFTDAETARRVATDQAYQMIRAVELPAELLARERPSGLPARRVDLSEVVVDGAGRVWFGTRGGEILRFTPNAAEELLGGWSLFNEADGLATGRAPNLLPLADGALWAVMAPSQNVNVFDGTAWHALPLPGSGVAPDGARLLQTKDGTIWVSARYVLYAYRRGAWATYARPDVPVPEALNLIMESRDGALWLAGPTIETFRIDYGTSRWLSLEDLNFQWESPAGALWFLHRDGRVVCRDGETWSSFGTEDGLIDSPVALLGTRDGTLWAAGSHEGVAATARLGDAGWTRETHPMFSWGVDWRASFEASDGSVWFGAAVDSSGPAKHKYGILQHRRGTWVHHHQPGRSPRADGSEDLSTLLPPGHRPEPIEKYTSLGESMDARIWAGRNVLVFHDGTRWTELHSTDQMRIGIIECTLTTQQREFWIGSREYGAWRFDGRSWKAYQPGHGLHANSVRSLAQTADGSIWAATDRGFSRFDGDTWMDDALPSALSVPINGGSLVAARSGRIWINHFTSAWNQRAWGKAGPVTPESVFRTRSHQFTGTEPRTAIISGASEVAYPGNISIAWSGDGAWRDPRDVRLQFSFRLDGGGWSTFSSDPGHAFFTLPAGRHRVEVRARDQDFNIDPTPALLDFVVLPPVWRQSWFIGLMSILGVLLTTQTIRVLLEKRRLRLAHDLLEERVRQRTAELELANRELESFSYSVSHDLRAPLRIIDGFSGILASEYHHKLDGEAQDSLGHIRAATQRMASLIDAMLALARVTRAALRSEKVDLSAIAREILSGLARSHPEIQVEVQIAPDVVVTGDPALLRNVLENLLGNAWKFTAGRPGARIEFWAECRSGEFVCHVRDNGAGFDRARARNLFGAFQRFHTAAEFPGTGVGLATVQRIIHRHGGRVEAESAVGAGATFTFSLPVGPLIDSTTEH